MTSSATPIQEFTFQIGGKLTSGSAFTSEFIVVAASDAEARDALAACIRDDPSIACTAAATLLACSTPSEASVAAYERSGAFTLFDPDLGRTS